MMGWWEEDEEGDGLIPDEAWGWFPEDFSHGDDDGVVRVADLVEKNMNNLVVG